MDLIKNIFNRVADPRVYFLTMAGMLALIVWKREKVATNLVGYGALGVFTAFFVLGGLDPNFRLIITKPDNVPIVGLIFLLVFFVWYSMKQAVVNDRRITKGEGPEEKSEADRVWVWPDLVYTELISLILCSVVLIVWSILLKAPLEQPANRAVTPNPSKAPWYFLGLQEMLVYFDPWLAGVVLPSLIIVGLIAIPYIDRNEKGNGYYTFNERKVEITLFLFGFVVLWCSLIVLGTFLRGPNWNFFGPFEYWDLHKLEALTNVNLSEYFWVRMLGQPLPSTRIAGPLGYLLRELPGLLLVLFYIGALPVILGKKIFKSYYEKLGPPRYYVAVFLFLMMMALPIKMLLRWIFNLKYIVGIPEIFFNI
jgi:Cytochrome b(C-terminal)/b6/petD